jgi:hypothetical protein
VDKGSKSADRLTERFSVRFGIWEAKLQALVDKECFYYNTETPHGGRVRREEDSDLESDEQPISEFAERANPSVEDYDYSNSDEQPTAESRGRVRREEDSDLESDEQPFAESAERADSAEDYDYSNSADDLVRYDKNNPQRGLRQITTGFRKWALRYITECPGQKNNKTHSSRSQRLYLKVLGEYNRFFKKYVL